MRKSRLPQPGKGPPKRVGCACAGLETVPVPTRLTESLPAHGHGVRTQEAVGAGVG